MKPNQIKPNQKSQDEVSELSPLEIINFVHMLGLFQVLSELIQFTHPEIWKQYAVLLADIMISDCLSVSLRTVQRIQKDLDEFNDDYEGAAAQKRWVSSEVIMKVQQLENFTLIPLIRTHKFVGEIQAIYV